MICLNSVIEFMQLSIAITLQVLQSTPVVKSFDVTAITGYASSGLENLSTIAFTFGTSPVIWAI